MKYRTRSLPPLYPHIHVTLIFHKTFCSSCCALISISWAVFLFVFLVLGIGPRSSHMRGVRSETELPLSPFLFLDYSSPDLLFSLAFCKLSSAWTTSPCVFLFVGSSYDSGCNLHITCLETPHSWSTIYC